MQTYHIKTFGCQMNISDSERIDSFMQSEGLSLVSEINNSDIVILNTCGVRQMAEDRVFGLVRNLKKNNSAIKIIVTGCLADRKDIHRRMKDVDLFTGISEFPKKFRKFSNCHPELVLGSKKSYEAKDSSKILKQGQHDMSGIRDSKIHNTSYVIHDTNILPNKEQINYLSMKPNHKNSFSAYVPIMTGCDNFCSYCVVPYARGREVSRTAEEIISEIKDLVSRGYKSITLLGQNVNSYKSKVPKAGKSIKPADEINFSKLLKMIDKIPGKFWIYFVSSHPKDMDDETIETIAKLKKVCENIHLPVQAGDDEILRRMNRKYTQKHYLGLISKIRTSFKKYKPGVPFSVSSDIIVGFPGETRKQFSQSAEVMKKSKFDMVFFGQYSPRPGTAAWKLNDDITIKEKERREQYLNEILKKTALANNKKYVGKILEVLIEKEKNGNYFGKTRTLKNVKLISSKKKLIGKILKVEITKSNIWSLEACLPKR